MRTALVDQGALLGPVLDPHRLATREFGLRQVPAALEEHASAERPPGARREETIEVRPGLRGQLLRRVRHARASDWSAERFRFRRAERRRLQPVLGASFRVCIGIVVGYKVQDNAMLEKRFAAGQN